MFQELRRRWYNLNHKYRCLPRQPGESLEQYNRRFRMIVGTFRLPDGLGAVLARLFILVFVGLIVFIILGILPTFLVLAAVVRVGGWLSNYKPPGRTRGF